MEADLRNTSKIKKELILQVLVVWGKYKKRKNKTPFVKDMRDLGWSDSILHGHGSFKICLWKNSIVAKYGTSEAPTAIAELEREVEQYKVIPRDVKKYFPRIYAFKNGLIVQDRVLVTCKDHTNEKLKLCNLSSVAHKIGNMNDYTHNHGHSLAGTVKFFDWVYNRKHPWLGDLSKSLEEK